MSQLLRRGFIAALAPVGVPLADIIVTDEAGDRACAVQVKTRRNIGSDGGWHMKAKHETIRGPSLFYCFVDFGTEAHHSPTTYVVPSSVVADTLAMTHRVWLARPGRGGRPHADGEMRRFLPSYAHLQIASHGPDWLERYRGEWEQLRTASTFKVIPDDPASGNAP